MTNVIWLTAPGAAYYTPSANCKAFYVEIVAGGGGSAGAKGTATTSDASGGGGGGGYAAKYYSTVADSYFYLIGNGGTAGDESPSAGGDGDQTIFDAYGTALAASGGSGSPATFVRTGVGPTGYGGNGGADPTNADMGIDGGVGGFGFTYSATEPLGGYGGNSALALTGLQPFAGAGPGIPGRLYGGGASGAASRNATGQAGGAGGQGVIKITEFIEIPSGASNDPWAAPLPGAYAPGTAGAIVGAIQQGKVTVISPVSQAGDNKIAVRAGDSWSIPITGLGDLSTRTKLWFALKDTPDISDAQSRAFAEETDGLSILNGAPYATPSDGGLVVTDPGLGNLTVVFEEAATVQLSGALSWAIKILNGAGNTVTLATGPFLITKAEIAANT